MHLEPWNLCKRKTQISKTLLVDFKGRIQHHLACTNIHELAKYYNTKILIKSKRKTQDRNKVFWQIKFDIWNPKLTNLWHDDESMVQLGSINQRNLTKALSREQVKSFKSVLESKEHMIQSWIYGISWNSRSSSMNYMKIVTCSKNIYSWWVIYGKLNIHTHAGYVTMWLDKSHLEKDDDCSWNKEGFIKYQIDDTNCIISNA